MRKIPQSKKLLSIALKQPDSAMSLDDIMATTSPGVGLRIGLSTVHHVADLP